MGARPSGGACTAARDQPGMAPLAARSAPDPAKTLAAGCLRQNQGSVPGSPENPQVAADITSGVRDRCGPRGRADLPLHIRGGAVRETDESAVDLFAHA